MEVQSAKGQLTCDGSITRHKTVGRFSHGISSPTRYSELRTKDFVIGFWYGGRQLSKPQLPISKAQVHDLTQAVLAVG